MIILLACYAMVLFSLASVFAPGGQDLPDRPVILNFLAACAVFIALPGMGATLAILRPANPIGWLFLATGLGFVMSIFTVEYVSRAEFGGAALPGVVLIDWLGAWMGTVSLGLAIVWIPLLFPDGHLPGPRWRPVAWAATVFILVGGLAQAIAQDQAHGYSGRLPNPVGIGGAVGESATLAGSLYFPAMAVLGVLSLTSLAIRFRRSGGVERAQLKWFLFAVAYFVIAMLIAIATTLDVAWYAGIFGLALLPVAAAVAILRYHLYEIDRLVSRTIAYSLVTGGLILIYPRGQPHPDDDIQLGGKRRFRGGRRVDPGRCSAIHTHPPPHPAHRGSPLRPGTLRRRADGRRVRLAAARRGGPAGRDRRPRRHGPFRDRPDDGARVAPGHGPMTRGRIAWAIWLRTRTAR